MVLYNPLNCYKHSSKLRTIKDAINSKSKTLGALNNAYGRDWTIAYINLWLIDLNDNSNVKMRMSDTQIEMTSERILDSYSLKIADITLFFRNVKDGVYGAYYENLGREKIMGWLKIYFDERCEMAQIISSTSHEVFSSSKDKMNPDVLKEMFKGVGDEEVEFKQEKRGLGKRLKETVISDLPLKIKTTTTKELKDYLINNDYNSKTYSEVVYKLVEKEIDLRNE